ncbi:hypothetical protein [Nocardioides sp.]|uniref:hypothetical protein n=1 Tax=Nocardioides sp. TaxID=35761 RepID=UPI002B26EAE9|nr:hypothetical protein [Nocardioides sp.]
MLIDTAVHPRRGKFVRIFNEDTSMESASADGVHGHQGHMLTGRPTVGALRMMLKVHGYTIDERFDWPGFIAERGYATGPVIQYHKGTRVTWVCTPV